MNDGRPPPSSGAGFVLLGLILAVLAFIAGRISTDPSGPLSAVQGMRPSDSASKTPQGGERPLAVDVRLPAGFNSNKDPSSKPARFSVGAITATQGNFSYAVVADNDTGEVRVIYGAWFKDASPLAEQLELLRKQAGMEPDRTWKFVAVKPELSPWK